MLDRRETGRNIQTTGHRRHFVGSAGWLDCRVRERSETNICLDAQRPMDWADGGLVRSSSSSWMHSDRPTGQASRLACPPASQPARPPDRPLVRQVTCRGRQANMSELAEFLMKTSEALLVLKKEHQVLVGSSLLCTTARWGNSTIRYRDLTPFICSTDRRLSGIITTLQIMEPDRPPTKAIRNDSRRFRAIDNESSLGHTSHVLCVHEYICRR